MTFRRFIFAAVLAALVLVSGGSRGGPSPAAATVAVDVMSFNIAMGQGLPNDSKDYVGDQYLNKVVEVIQSRNPDLCGCQEVDKHRPNARFRDEAKFVASRVKMNYAWGEASAKGPFGLVKHGNMVMTKGRIVSQKSWKFRSRATEGDGKSKETRGVTWALCEIDGVRINLLSTHFGFPEEPRVGQAKELVAILKTLRGPIILVGDFNTTEGSPSHKVISSYLTDAYVLSGSKKPRVTIGSGKTIDFIFVSRRHWLAVDAYALPRTQASDHAPMFARLILNEDAYWSERGGPRPAPVAPPQGLEGLNKLIMLEDLR